ncbi:helicase-associated domain-containing protein [Paenibacillus sp. UNC451MF]|uniref:helicase-associated domain-containing protein n=1 Tax=Paenibacillus sp. UNC451MF TaxID=1449063 RepID=UPI0004915C72|nr:helicase-associated domain-containing protein [Paenibacillus sp. UNC451MF]
MNQVDYIAIMPQTLRKQIEAEAAYAPWLKQGHTLESMSLNQVIMETVYNQMTLQEQQVLRLIVTTIGCEPFDSGKLEKLAAPVMSGADTRVGLLMLLKKGICFAFRKSWGEHVYRMALDGLALWHRILFMDAVEESCEALKPAYVELSETGGKGLAEDIFQSMVYIGQQQLKLTKGGTLPKRQLQKLGEQLSLRDEWFQGTGIKYVYADIYSLKIAVIMECLTRLQLMDLDHEQLGLNEVHSSYWLSLKESEQTKALYQLWKSVLFPGEAWMQHAVFWLEWQPTGVWISSQSLKHWLSAHQLMPIESDIENQGNGFEMLEQQWLLPLIAFGWMEKGWDTAGDACYRWRNHPLNPELTEDEDVRFYVQPDFEVLVPPGVSFSVRWELAVFSEQYKSDAVSVYKLNKECMQRGLENGRSFEGIIHFLERHALYDIPDNVKLTLEQWAKPFGQLQFSQVILLRCENTDVADRVRKLTVSSDFFLEAVGELAWIVKSDQLGSLRAMLDKAGWIPGKMALLDGTVSEVDSTGSSGGHIMKVMENTENGDIAFLEREPEMAAKGFIYSRHNIAYFEMEQRLPNIAELYPDLNGIPTGWMKDYRTYHASTRREIVEKAMEWKAAVQVRHNGKDRLIAPRKLQETRGTWSMTGLEPSELQEICWLADDWQEMKIILPGINDKY